MTEFGSCVKFEFVIVRIVAATAEKRPALTSFSSGVEQHAEYTHKDHGRIKIPAVLIQELIVKLLGRHPIRFPKSLLGVVTVADRGGRSSDNVEDLQ